ncbi:hypothetical protein RD792_008527 [Penstemon davidsonii]|uniref:Glycosyltransferases n=1 Tax=Penstemon davidsonii TaxID=160366 RepID=A0ABR0DAK3_9LAMI|nr:hypothetical protein RD792_008527 [Penstemon davidsonii]
MASIRRALSPVPRPGALMNGEASQVASPLSKSSSNSQNYTPPSGSLSSSLGSLEYALYKAQSFILGLFSHRSSRPFDKPRVKGQFWRRAFLHFLMCFIVGVFVGLTPSVPLNLTTNIMYKNQEFDFGGGYENDTLVVSSVPLKENSTSETNEVKVELKNETFNGVFRKLLIVITPTITGPLQNYYLNRLSNTLKLVPHPLLWIVVEMDSQSIETAELLMNTGVMYRHLVCNIKNSTGTMDRSVLLRNTALSHIEKHRLDGIVYFADDDRIYSTDLFDQMRQISRFGAWTVAKLVESKGKIFLEGPICNGSQVIGWHVSDMAKRYRRFHVDMSGFAFNSIIIWDQKRWNRPTLEPIRQLETVQEGFQASTFIQQVVEDESQMECFSMNSSEIMVWHHTADLHSYPQNWFTSNNLGSIVPLS